MWDNPDVIFYVNSNLTGCFSFLTTGGNINTLPDGVHMYNGWADMTGDKPFSNAYGIWIKRTPYKNLAESERIDIVFRSNGTIYFRGGGTSGTWTSK